MENKTTPARAKAPATITRTQQKQHLQNDILESALGGQEKARLAQEELDRQGKHLRDALDEATNISTKQAASARQAIKGLINEARSSKKRKILLCCAYFCCYCCCRKRLEAYDKANATPQQQSLHPVHLDVLSTDSDVDDETNVTNQLDSLKSQLQDQKAINGLAINKPWKRTLAPLARPGGLNMQPYDIWRTQIDASLSQLQQLAEEIGQSLEEQIQLAQLLNLYLQYGTNQVIGMNEDLASAQKANLF